jgi:H+/gluconate symporter-like permease
VEFAETLQPVPTKSYVVEKLQGPVSPQPANYIPTGLRIATLLLAGMIVGAILVLAWFSHSHGSHKVFNSRLPNSHVVRVDHRLT